MKAVAVVVTYEPDPNRLASLCDDLARSGISVLVVDNSESGLELHLPEPSRLLRLGFNSGIAAAQNTGIEFARRSGADAILFFDQDSCPSAGALEALLRALQSGIAPVVAPVAIDESTGRVLPPLRLDQYGRVHKVLGRKTTATVPVPADIVISAGTTALMSVFDKVGGMDEELFIDYVDIDWCLRCRAAAVAVRIIPLAFMVHRIGLREIRFGAAAAAVHSPQRTYYKTRNCLLLFRRKWVPSLFVAREFASALMQIVLITIVESNRAQHLRAFLAGLWHGVTQRTGRYDLAVFSGRG
jgi:rhamnosyltransferase